MRYESVAEAVGHTPLIRLKNIEKEYALMAKLYAKAEGMNPAGSVKDRAAAEMLAEAERSGRLNADTLLIEPDQRQHGDRACGALCGQGVSADDRHARHDERGTPSVDCGVRGGAGFDGGQTGHGGRHRTGGEATRGDGKQPYRGAVCQSRQSFGAL